MKTNEFVLGDWILKKVLNFASDSIKLGKKPYLLVYNDIYRYWEKEELYPEEWEYLSNLLSSSVSNERFKNE